MAWEEGICIEIRKALRDSRELYLPRYKTAMGQSTFEYAAAKKWNDLPKELRACETLRIFKIKTFKLLIESDKTQHICSVFPISTFPIMHFVYVFLAPQTRKQFCIGIVFNFSRDY